MISPTGIAHVELTASIALIIGVPLTVVSGINNTGTGFSQVFALPSGSGRFGTQLGLQTKVAHGAYTVLTADLEVSYDGGTTWSFYAGTFDLYAVPSQPANVIGGAIYRINVKTFTGSGTPLIDVIVLAG